jgi:serralysin
MAYDASVEADYLAPPQTEDPQFYLNADARTGSTVSGKTSLSVEAAGYTLIGGGPGWSAAMGVAFTVTYAFRSSAPSSMPDDTGGFSRFNAAQIQQAELALTSWSDVANIKFVRVGAGTTGDTAYSDQAAILFSNYSSGADGAAAFGYYPGSTAASSRSGDVWFNSTLGYNTNPTAGNYGGMVLVHELGHAIGLAHPSTYDASDDVAPTYAADADYYEDSRQYTVMSYFNERNTGANYSGAYAASPLLDDISAAQQEYGANMTTRTGDTVYGFNSTADRAWYSATSASSKLIFAVWDAGGSDTLDFSGYSVSQVIDLRPGYFSDVGGLVGNVTIAMGANIENARGGAGVDQMNGNALGNFLRGEAGGDVINGWAGDDLIYGGDGNDMISGGEGFDQINGNMGVDVAYGGNGTDWVVGGQGDDQIFGDSGDDIVYGNMGNDIAYGGAGADIVRGGQGNDVISGDDGDDWLAGDRGSDNITGGKGADIFYSFAGGGLDLITDFNRTEGDRIQLDPGQAHTVYQSGSNTVIDLGNGDQIILANYMVTNLAGDWLIGG